MTRQKLKLRCPACNRPVRVIKGELVCETCTRFGLTRKGQIKAVWDQVSDHLARTREKAQ